MATPPSHSYPSPTQAQISDGTHPFYAPHQQQPAPQAVMDPHQRPREQSIPGQSHETYSSRPTPHPSQQYSDSHGNQEYAMQQMHQHVAMQGSHLDPSGNPLSKRPKTSRACDQCRGKKTRCDPVPGDDGNCVSCQRNNQRCDFSREPQKRGPSKGYIKELAERVGALESDRTLVSSPVAPFAAIAPGTANYSSPLASRFTSKRSHSVSEDLQNSAALQAQLRSPAEIMPAANSDSGKWALYYAKTHPFFPFLAHSKDRMQANLDKSSPKVHEAFDAALIVYNSPDQYDSTPPELPNSGTPQASITYMISQLQHHPERAQTQAERLVALQAVLLMIFAAEFSSPGNAVNRGWYDQAYGQCSRMSQSLGPVHDHIGSDLDAHRLLARRAFLTLVTLERFNAAGAAAGTLFPDQLTRTSVVDKLLLGKVGYSALQASFVLGHVIDTMLDPISCADPKLWKATCAEKDRIVEYLELETTDATAVLPQFINLYFHSQQTSNPALSVHSLDLAIDVVKSLVNSGTTFPLGHHMAALALKIFGNAIHNRESSEEAHRALAEVHTELAKRQLLSSAGGLWNHTFRGIVDDLRSAVALADAGERSGGNSTTDRAGLQHLADAAVGETEDGKAGSVAIEDQVTVPAGYLTWVAQALVEK